MDPSSTPLLRRLDTVVSQVSGWPAGRKKQCLLSPLLLHPAPPNLTPLPHLHSEMDTEENFKPGWLIPRTKVSTVRPPHCLFYEMPLPFQRPMGECRGEEDPTPPNQFLLVFPSPPPPVNLPAGKPRLCACKLPANSPPCLLTCFPFEGCFPVGTNDGTPMSLFTSRLSAAVSIRSLGQWLPLGIA